MTRRALTLGGLLSGLLALQSGPVIANDRGDSWPTPFPLEVRIARPLALVFLRPTPLGPPPEKTETSVSGQWGNDFRRSGPVDEDAEVGRLAVRWRQRWGSRGAETWLMVPVLARGGGLLDGAIDAWHRGVLGWEDPVRAGTARFRSVVARDGRYRFGSAAGLGDVSAGVATRWQGLVVQGAIELPTGDAARLLGSGGVELAASIERQWRLDRRWSIGGLLGVTYQGSAPHLPGARRWVDSSQVWVAYQPTADDTWLLQWVSEAASVTTGVASADSTARVLAVGYRRRTGPRSYTEVVLTEDRDLASGRLPWLVNQGPDVTFGVRFVWR